MAARTGRRCSADELRCFEEALLGTPIDDLAFPEILTDPLVRLVMKADGVDPKALENELSDIAASLEVTETGRAGCPLPC